ncbi:TonB-dependent receptor [Candidatus Poribacteria bacterium]|nr:TonB-dependent receptor [Candidatus Poribacteria bacterium]
MKLSLALCILFSFFLFILFGIADAATLDITIKDSQTGKPINGISVTIATKAGIVAQGNSDVNGFLSIQDLTAGTYTISTSSSRYSIGVVRNILVASDETKTVKIMLLPLNSEILELEKVSVTASRRKEKVLEAPASVAIIDNTQIQDRAAMSVTEHLKSLRAVDVITSGIGTSYVVVRGFNNVFSGNLLSLVDNRIASVPSLRVNSYTLIPTISEDIEQIEVVSGPGAALYGPNSANGVMHIITRSPFTSQGTTVSLGGGERSTFIGSLRHAGVINDSVGYKLTGNYTRGHDWEEGRAIEDIEGKEAPLFDTSHARGEFRIDYSPKDETTVILASGLTQASGIELTGIGAGQTKNWTYGYAQARFIYKDLFAQFFTNQSDAGDTYILRTGLPTIDNSNLHVGQIQHSIRLGDIQRFTYGFDALLTRPDTEGTINGVNEDKDDINELGVYLQSETNILPQLKFLAAGRADQHNHLNDIVLSPRVALALQPNEDHNVRVTYNRAFNTPGTSNLFLDILSSVDAFKLGSNFEPALGYSPNIDIRAQGVPSDTGFTFKRSENGTPLFRSPFSALAKQPDGTYIPLNDPVFTNVMWGVGRSAVMSGAKPAFEAGLKAQGLPDDTVSALSTGLTL